MFFNLRNYGLCVDQMQDLGLDIAGIVKVLAEALAEALAHCYWKARVDANDVEFVRAPTPDTDPRHGSRQPVFPLVMPRACDLDVEL
jgi:hypothetical protein